VPHAWYVLLLVVLVVVLVVLVVVVQGVTTQLRQCGGAVPKVTAA